MCFFTPQPGCKDLTEHHNQHIEIAIGSYKALIQGLKLTRLCNHCMFGCLTLLVCNQDLYLVIKELVFRRGPLYV